MIKIPEEKIMFVRAMLIVRSDISKKSKEYKEAKKFLDERFKKQNEEVEE